MEEDLDAIAKRISLAIESRLFLPHRMCVNYRLDPQLFQLGADGIRVVTGVGYERRAARVVCDDGFRDR